MIHLQCYGSIRQSKGPIHHIRWSELVFRDDCSTMLEKCVIVSSGGVKYPVEKMIQLPIVDVAPLRRIGHAKTKDWTRSRGTRKEFIPHAWLPFKVRKRPPSFTKMKGSQASPHVRGDLHRTKVKEESI